MQVAIDKSSYPEVSPVQHLNTANPNLDLPPPPIQKSTILGLRKRTFYIVLALLLVVIIIAAVIGGVLASKRSISPNPSANSTSAGSSDGETPLAVLGSSQLAAINWTDGAGLSYKAVFYQDKSSNLTFALWDSSNKTWSSSRIRDLVPEASKGNIQPKTGTPLTAVVRASPWTAAPWKYPFGISLFYVDGNQVIQELASTDMRASSWTIGNISSSRRSYETNGAAQIAAWWSLCTSECDGSIWLFYQDTGQRIQFANSSDWNQTPYQLIGSGVTPGTGLAVTAVQNNLHGAINGPAIYYESNSLLVEAFWDDFVWHPGMLFVLGFSSVALCVG
jgi:hypothetical protein